MSILNISDNKDEKENIYYKELQKCFGADTFIVSVAFEKDRNPAELLLGLMAVAFRGMEDRWEKDWHKRYHAVLKASNGVTYVSDRPGRTAFFKRNEWMVNNSTRLIAVYTGAPGGTKATIQYAKRHGREVVLIEK